MIPNFPTRGPKRLALGKVSYCCSGRRVPWRRFSLRWIITADESVTGNGPYRVRGDVVIVQPNLVPANRDGMGFDHLSRQPIQHSGAANFP